MSGAYNYSYLWNTEEIAPEITVTPDVTTEYSVTVTDGRINTVKTITINVNAYPEAIITPQGPTTFCTGGSVILQANTGEGLSYQWKLNDGDITDANLDSFLATEAGRLYSCSNKQ